MLMRSPAIREPRAPVCFNVFKILALVLNGLERDTFLGITQISLKQLTISLRRLQLATVVAGTGKSRLPFAQRR